ncbi:MAG: SRPBCC family protein [Synechococcales bacterium]|nr:SRPBCC family protein [Synechococcales bacterium]
MTVPSPQRQQGRRWPSSGRQKLPWHQRRWHRGPVSLIGLMAIALLMVLALPQPGVAQLFNSAVDQLPAQERAALRSGQVTVAGGNGSYTGRVLANAPVNTAWDVLTDYGNFARFFPSVTSSRLLESEGNRRVFEQVNEVRVFPVTRRSRIVISATESYPQQIAFRLIEGDVNSLQGVWRLDPVAPYAGAAPNQVLITHQVTVDPGSSATRGLFLNIYENTLAETLTALKQETERRARR